MKKSNIILVGMPSSGKSTIGGKLAEKLGMCFIDTDTVIRNNENRELRDIVNTDGLERFLQVQEEAILGLDLKNHVIATGGSAVYGDASMQHLKKHGVAVYLKTEFSEIEQRVAAGRRFARNDGQTLHDLYMERIPLYEGYADIIADCTGKTVDGIISEIVFKLGLSIDNGEK